MINSEYANFPRGSGRKVIANKSKQSRKASDFCVKMPICHISRCDRPQQKVQTTLRRNQARQQPTEQRFKCFKCFGKIQSRDCRQCKGSAQIFSSHPLVQRIQRIFASKNEQQCEIGRHINKEFLLRPNGGNDVINEESFSMQDQHSVFSKDPDKQQESDHGVDECELQIKPNLLQNQDPELQNLRKTLEQLDLQERVNIATQNKQLIFPQQKQGSIGLNTTLNAKILQDEQRDQQDSRSSQLDSSLVNICRDWSESSSKAVDRQSIKEKSFNSLKSSFSQASNKNKTSKVQYDDSNRLFNLTDAQDYQLKQGKLDKSSQQTVIVEKLLKEGVLCFQNQLKGGYHDVQGRKMHVSRNRLKYEELPNISFASYLEGEQTISIKILPRQQRDQKLSSGK